MIRERWMIRPLAVFIMFYCGRVSSVTHSLTISHTVGQEQNSSHYNMVRRVNGVRFMPFNGSNGWMIQSTDEEVNFWTQRMQGDSEDIKSLWPIISNDDHFNHSPVQMRYSCEVNDDNYTSGATLQYAYDGEELMSLNVEFATWNASSSIKSKWDEEGKIAQDWKHYLENDCIDHLRVFANRSRASLDFKSPPNASVFQNCSSSPQVVCHATGFFPKAVIMSWKKDGEDMHEDVELRETLPNQDGSFQKRSILKVPAEELQKHNYTCVIQHSSLEKEMVLPVSDGKILRAELCGGSDGGSDGGSAGMIYPEVVVLAATGIAIVIAIVIAIIAIFVWKCIVRKKPQEVEQNGTELHPLNTSPSDAPV